MKITSFFTVVALAYLSTSVLAAPTSQTASSSGSSTCSSPIVRKEWRKLSTAQKKQYIAAVQCLGKKSSIARAAVPGARSRYDDFQGVHSLQTDHIHWVGHFIVWHRLMVAEYERALRNECGYTGGQPYWDWTIDAASNKNINSWEIFNPGHGFGGNGPFIEITPEQNPLGIEGRTGGGCVKNGPFTMDKFKLSLGPTNDVSISNPRCLTRDFAPPVIKRNLISSVWNEVLNQPDFGRFARRLEAEPNWSVLNVHGGGHFGIGGVLGTMGDPYNSPGDPLFYLHHGNLDRLYYLWQKKNPSTRLHEVSGPINPFDYTNQIGGNVTLDFTINMAPLTGNIKLRDLLNTVGGRLCYKYE